MQEEIINYIRRNNLSEQAAKKIINNKPLIEKIKKDISSKKVIKFLRSSAEVN